MNGCDRADQLAGYYNIFNRKTYKWWKKLFFWMIELSQINAMVLFKKTRSANNQRKFCTSDISKRHFEQLELLALSMIPQEEREKSKNNFRPENVSLIARYTGNVHLIFHSSEDKNCVVCSKPGSHKRTNFFCQGCLTGDQNTYLHPKGCFEQFHTLK